MRTIPWRDVIHVVHHPGATAARLELHDDIRIARDIFFHRLGEQCAVNAIGSARTGGGADGYSLAGIKPGNRLAPG